MYRPDGLVFASYLRSDSASTCPPMPSHDKTPFSLQSLTVVQPVVLKGSRIGTLLITYDLLELLSACASTASSS